MISDLVKEQIEQTVTQEESNNGAGKEHDFLAIEGMIVVGMVIADCAECAWERLFTAHPNARLACFTGEFDGKGCLRTRPPQGKWVPFHD